MADLDDWQKRYKCAKCDGIVYSKFANQTSRCSCGAIAVEQAPWMNCKMGKDENFIDLSIPDVDQEDHNDNWPNFFIDPDTPWC